MQQRVLLVYGGDYFFSEWEVLSSKWKNRSSFKDDVDVGLTQHDTCSAAEYFLVPAKLAKSRSVRKLPLD
jgi:hypothetical protein